MGSSQSSHAKNNKTSGYTGKSLPKSVRGRKSIKVEVAQARELLPTKPVVEEPLDQTADTDEEAEDTDSSSIYDSESDEEEDEEEQGEEEERLRILEDAKALKQTAAFYLHPEKSVEEDGLAKARCFFDRPSAPARLSKEEAEERAQILEDGKALKKLAVDYLHPELPVETTDSTACGRNYFGRSSAPEQLSVEDAEEKARVLADCALLKKFAVDYLHPELPVTTTDSTSTGRNVFNRPSAFEQESLEEAEEKARIFEECNQLKQLAVDYMHPELPVVASDSTVFGRNYFARSSAPEQESLEEAEERALVIEECKHLKQLAVDYMHPEMPVSASDPTVFGRNFFARSSAPEQESFEEAEERARILAECKQLKQLAVDYMHPELPVVASDPTVFGRNFFARASAPEQESLEEAEERAIILAECKQFKQLAMDYMHPELPVVTSDPTVFGRNYFSRQSASEQESTEEAEERASILAECKQLKQLAVDYMHPEIPVSASDPTVFGRNFFARASAPEQESLEEAEERASILAECKQLKQLAVDYMHPEMPVSASDPTVFGRNYFSRASAAEQESLEEAEERARVLSECKQLKQLAVDFMHPELPVSSKNFVVCGRNYFDRPAAPGHWLMIQTFPAHDEHDDHEHHDDHGDQFGMDEDMEMSMFDDMRAELMLSTGPTSGAPKNEDEEGKLSRSPSSVMLYIDDPMYD